MAYDEEKGNFQGRQSHGRSGQSHGHRGRAWHGWSQGAAWGAAEVMGATRDVAEVSEVADDGVTRGRTVGPLASVPWAV
jgi:hypothetical protein